MSLVDVVATTLEEVVTAALLDVVTATEEDRPTLELVPTLVDPVTPPLDPSDELDPLPTPLELVGGSDGGSTHLSSTQTFPPVQSESALHSATKYWHP